VILSDLRSTGVLAVVRRELRPLLGEWRRLYYNRLWGMDIGRGCRISFSAKLDKSYPHGIHIGEDTAINFGACILTHDTPRAMHVHTWIGKECNIGANSLIMPGVKIGDNCVVAAASVVMKDVPSNSLVAGNPARIMEKGIRTGRLGIMDRTVRPDFGTVSPVSIETAPEKAAS
jgi:acetyltransferase-like isoleucine patch superfamily enzyme